MRSRDEVETQNNIYIELTRKIMSCSSENIDGALHDQNDKRKRQKKNEQKDRHKLSESDQTKINIMGSAGCDWNVDLDFSYQTKKG